MLRQEDYMFEAHLTCVERPYLNSKQVTNTDRSKENRSGEGEQREDEREGV